ncbi:MAG: hypothetical protein LBH90_02880 [Tannerella sp.]|nr:hypothetical protein [Tannerella sp.]
MTEKELAAVRIAYNLVRHLIYRDAERAISLPLPKKISFTNALRLITRFCLTKEVGSSIIGLRTEIEKLGSKIRKRFSVSPPHEQITNY